jgi:hypothetical protein
MFFKQDFNRYYMIMKKTKQKTREDLNKHVSNDEIAINDKIVIDDEIGINDIFIDDEISINDQISNKETKKSSIDQENKDGFKVFLEQQNKDSRPEKNSRVEKNSRTEKDSGEKNKVGSDEKSMISPTLSPNLSYKKIKNNINNLSKSDKKRPSEKKTHKRSRSLGDIQILSNKRPISSSIKNINYFSQSNSPNSNVGINNIGIDDRRPSSVILNMYNRSYGVPSSPQPQPIFGVVPYNYIMMPQPYTNKSNSNNSVEGKNFNNRSNSSNNFLESDNSNNINNVMDFPSLKESISIPNKQNIIQTTYKSALRPASNFSDSESVNVDSDVVNSINVMKSVIINNKIGLNTAHDIICYLGYKCSCYHNSHCIKTCMCLLCPNHYETPQRKENLKYMVSNFEGIFFSHFTKGYSIDDNFHGPYSVCKCPQCPNKKPFHLPGI